MRPNRDGYERGVEVDICNVFKPNIRKMKANIDVDGLIGALRYES